MAAGLAGGAGFAPFVGTVVGGPPTGTRGTPVTGGLPGVVVVVVLVEPVVVVTAGSVVVVVAGTVVAVVVDGAAVVLVVVVESGTTEESLAEARPLDAQAPGTLRRTAITPATLAAAAARRVERGMEFTTSRHFDAGRGLSVTPRRQPTLSEAHFGIPTGSRGAAAFRLVRPGPPARTGVGPALHPLGARAAADRGIPLVEQRIERYVVVRHVAGDILICPSGDGIDLDQAA